MGLFDYALNNFSPYQGGLLGALGLNNMGGVAQSYGGYAPGQNNDQPAPALPPGADIMNPSIYQMPPQYAQAQDSWSGPLASFYSKLLPPMGNAAQAQPVGVPIPPQMAPALPPPTTIGAAPGANAGSAYSAPSVDRSGLDAQMYGAPAAQPSPAQPPQTFGAQIPPQAQDAMAQQQPAQGPSFGQRMQNIAGILDPSQRTELKETGTDPFTGQKTFAQYNPITGQLRPVGMGESQQGVSGLGAFQNAQRNGVTGEALYQHLPENLRPLVKQYVEGRAPIPTAAALRNPAVIAIMQAANAIDPTFDAANYPARANLIKEYAKGTPSSLGGQRNSGNTAVGHLGTVSQAAVDLGNWDAFGPDVSKGLNWIRQHGSTEQAAKANALNNAIDRYVAEVGKYYSGSSSGGAHEREAARQRFSSTKTPAELAAAIASERELFGSKLDQMKEQAVATLGENHPLTKEIIQPHAVEGFKLVDKNLATLRGGAPASVGVAPTATGPNGQKVTLKNGQWVPVQ